MNLESLQILALICDFVNFKSKGNNWKWGKSCRCSCSSQQQRQLLHQQWTSIRFSLFSSSWLPSSKMTFEGPWKCEWAFTGNIMIIMSEIYFISFFLFFFPPLVCFFILKFRIVEEDDKMSMSVEVLFSIVWAWKRQLLGWREWRKEREESLKENLKVMKSSEKTSIRSKRILKVKISWRCFRFHRHSFYFRCMGQWNIEINWMC